MLPVPSAMLSVQVMPSERVNGPLVMRRWPVSDRRLRLALAAYRRAETSSLGYEPYDVRLPCLGQSPVTELASTDLRHEVVQAFFVSPVSACLAASRAQMRAQISLPACWFASASMAARSGTRRARSI